MSGAMGAAPMPPLDVASVLQRIAGLRVLVVGDICLDRWCIYDPALSEPSRETGIPRIAVKSYEATPGAGGTVSNNLIAMGVSTVSVLGVQGDDGAAYELRRALAHRNINGSHMVTDPHTQTFTYTKYLNVATGEEDLPRTDFINAKPWSAGVEAEVIEQLKIAAVDADVILVSDQAETQEGGVVTGGVRDAIAAIAVESPQKTIWVDSRVRAEHFREVVVKTNEEEAQAAFARLAGVANTEDLRRYTKAPLFLITHGGDGVEIVAEGQAWHVPTQKVANPVDICGAGDSFSAGAAMALASIGDPVLAARFGNIVASVTIMKKGTGTASPEEIIHAAERMTK